MQHPSLDAEIPYDGARINITIPPVVSKPTLSLRIHRDYFRNLAALQYMEMFNEEQMKFMKEAVKAKRNIIISEETGSGKTTLLTALVNEIPPAERLIVIEDTHEIICRLKNVSYMLVGRYFSGEDAVKSAMRKNPSRIIYGEVRDRSAFDLIKAWNTAHKGGLGTIYANSCDAVRTRLLSLCGEASASSQEAAIDEVLDVVIQIEVQGGVRKIAAIKEFGR